MTDHVFGRRGYDDDARDLLIRIDERTTRIETRQVEDRQATDARLTRVEADVAALKMARGEAAAVTQERGKWLGLAVKVGQKAIPAGGGLAGIVALAHYWSGQSR